MSELGIVIVNYNSTDYLARCLEGIFRQTVKYAFHVVVVDNASDSQDFSILQERYPDVAFLTNKENLGFSKACNQGIRYRDTDFYLFLNPDCEVEAGSIDLTLDCLKASEKVGIVGCRVNNPDGTLQKACRRSIPRPSVALYRFTGLSALFPDHPRFGAYNLSNVDDGENHEVEAVSGSFLMFRKEVLATAGYMDEDFFLYGEDLDFCHRAGKAGWKVLYFPQAQVIHHKRVSSSRNPVLSNFHFYDAMRIFYEKHFRESTGPLGRVLIPFGIKLLYWRSLILMKLFSPNSVGSDH